MKRIRDSAFKNYIAGFFLIIFWYGYALIRLGIFFADPGSGNYGVDLLARFFLSVLIFYLVIALAACFVFLGLVSGHRKRRKGNAYSIVIIVFAGLSFMFEGSIYLVGLPLLFQDSMLGLLPCVTYIIGIPLIIVAAALQIGYKDPSAGEKNYPPRYGQYYPPQGYAQPVYYGNPQGNDQAPPPYPPPQSAQFAGNYTDPYGNPAPYGNPPQRNGEDPYRR